MSPQPVAPPLPALVQAAERLGVRPGPLLMLLATLVFTIMLGLVKVARAELSAMEIVLWRAVVGVPLAVLAARGLPWRPRRPRLLLLRAVLGFGAMICFFTAAKGLALADHSLLTKLQPLLVAVIAPLALGASEKPGPRIWTSLVLGLLGCGLLLAPDLEGGGVWGLWAIASAFFSAGAHTTLRALGRSDHPAVVVMWFQAATVPLALGMQWAWDGAPPGLPPLHLWPLLGAIGAAAVLGQSLMTRAYQLDAAAVVAGASYSAPLWALAGDLLFFSATPGLHTLVGGALIVAAGLAVTWDRSKVVAPAEH